MGRFHAWKGRLYKTGGRYPVNNGPPYRSTAGVGEYPSDAAQLISAKILSLTPALVTAEVNAGVGWTGNLNFILTGVNISDGAAINITLTQAVVPADTQAGLRTKIVTTLDAHARVVAAASGTYNITIAPDGGGTPTWVITGCVVTTSGGAVGTIPLEAA